MTRRARVAETKASEFSRAAMALFKGDFVPRDVDAQSKHVASIPQQYIDAKMAMKTPLGENITQIDWTRIANQALINTFNCIEPSSLMQNPNIFMNDVEEAFDCLKPEAGMMREIFSRAGTPEVQRDILTRARVEDELDWEMTSEIRRVPMDKSMRVFFLSLSHELVDDYLKMGNDPPEPLLEGKYDKDVANTMIDTVLRDEYFYGDENDPGEVKEYLIDRTRVEQIEVDMIRDAKRFPIEAIERLVESSNTTIRSRLACTKGISKETQMKLARDNDNAVRKKVAECTKDCEVLKEIESGTKVSKTTKEALLKRRDELKCK